MANVLRDYNEKRDDGWYHVIAYDDGTFSSTKISPSDYGNAGISGGGGGSTYNTPNGQKTLAQMRQELATAGYNGAQDDASIIAAYNSTASGAGAGGMGDASQKLLDAIASGDREKFDEAIREYNATLAENQRQFNVGTQEGERKLYSDLAQNLLSTAASLRGPRNYAQFNQYTSGGRDLFSQLFGSQPRADFSAPTGQIEPMTLASLAQDLGFRTIPGAPSTGASTTAGQYKTVNGTKTIDDMLNELKGAQWGPAQGTTRPSDADIIGAYQNTTKGDVTPMFAEGGIVTEPTKAIIGDNG